VFHLSPGIAVDSAGAGNAGVNSFPHTGATFLSVGAGEGAALAVGSRVVMAVVIREWADDGTVEPLPLQLAIDATNPARITTRATKRGRSTESVFANMNSPIDPA
jgi:hypothetical protein